MALTLNIYKKVQKKYLKNILAKKILNNNFVNNKFFIIIN